MKYLGGHTENGSFCEENGSFCEELLSGNDFEAVLVNFCCYNFGGNASEVVQEMSTGVLGLYANSLRHLIL